MKSINPTYQKRSSFFKLIILLLAVTISSSEIFGQSKVIGLRYNNQNMQSVNTTVMPPGQGGSKAVLSLGDQLVSGTRLIIPAGTIVMLQSPGGRQICRSTTGKTMEYTVKFAEKSENHIVRGQGATVQSTVTKSVGYNYRVNNGRGTTSAARGTEFTFTDMSQGDNEQAYITTQEGSINIIDKVPLTIGGQSSVTNKRGQPITKAVSRVQNQGDAQYTSSDTAVDYVDFDAAIRYIAAEINAIEDPEERADNQLCLGDLYMELENYGNAATYFNEAYQFFYYYYGPEDTYTLESKLSLAEAYYFYGYQQDGIRMLGEVKQTLKNLEYWNNEDLAYIESLEYFNDDDVLAYQIICEEQVEVFGLLGWVYEIEGETNSSDYYYQMMLNGTCRQY